MLRSYSSGSPFCVALLVLTAACGAEQAATPRAAQPGIYASPPPWGNERLGATMVQGTEPASDKAPVTVVDETRQPPPAATSPAPLPSLAGLDDAQFAGAAQEINDRTIRLSQLGESKSSAGGVGRFAHELATSHLALQTRLRMAENRASIAPDDSSLCSVLKSSAQREVTALTSVSGPDFDRYYVDAEVRQQQESLDLLDKMLQQMMTPALRHELQEMRGHIAAHLRSAEALRQDLQKR